MSGNQEEAFKRAVRDGNDKEANENYEKYKNSMTSAGQKPKSRSDIIGK